MLLHLHVSLLKLTETIYGDFGLVYLLWRLHHLNILIDFLQHDRRLVHTIILLWHRQNLLRQLLLFMLQLCILEFI